MCLRLQPYGTQAATLCVSGCNPMSGRLQPYVRQAATLCVPGCNPMSRRLQPPVSQVRHLVVDEVDEAFRPPYLQPTRRLLDSFNDGRPLQIVFASATSDAPAVRRAASQLMRAPLMLRLTRAAGAGRGGGGGGGDAAAALPSTIQHGCLVLPQRKHLEALQKLARLEPPPKCARSLLPCRHRRPPQRVQRAPVALPASLHCWLCGG